MVGMHPSTSPPKVASPPLDFTAPLDSQVPPTHSLPLPHLLPHSPLLLLATAAQQRLRGTSSQLPVTRQTKLQLILISPAPQPLIQCLIQWHQSSLFQWLPPNLELNSQEKNCDNCGKVVNSYWHRKHMKHGDNCYVKFYNTIVNPFHHQDPAMADSVKWFWG